MDARDNNNKKTPRISKEITPCMSVYLLSPWTKWPPFWQTTIPSAFSWMKMIEFQYAISLECVPKGLIDNKSALFHAMAWCRTGDGSLTEPKVTKFTDAYMRH